MRREENKVAKFANDHHLSVTFHCGEIYDDNGESSSSPYSDAKYIEDLAKKYPKVNFIASHINWPNFDSLFSTTGENLSSIIFSATSEPVTTIPNFVILYG